MIYGIISYIINYYLTFISVIYLNEDNQLNVQKSYLVVNQYHQ